MKDFIAIFVAYGLSIWPALAALGTVVAIELAAPKVRYSLRDRISGVGINALLPIFAIPISLALQSLWKMLEFVPILDLTGLHPVMLAVYLTLSYDLVNYWEHRFEHRFLWPVHAVHHAPTELHAANSFHHPLQMVGIFVFQSLHYSLIKLDSYTLPVLAGSFIAVWAYLDHAPIRIGLGPLRRILVDPQYHRIHHSLEPRHFNKNFAPTFSIWDQLFGTAYFPDKDEYPEVGVAGLSTPRSMWSVLVMPFEIILANRRNPPSSSHELVGEEGTESAPRGI